MKFKSKGNQSNESVESKETAHNPIFTNTSLQFKNSKCNESKSKQNKVKQSFNQFRSELKILNDLVDKEELRLFKEQLDGQADSLGLNKTLEQSLEALKFYKTIIEEINELNKKVLKQRMNNLT